MPKSSNRISFSTTMHPETHLVLTQLAEDIERPMSRAIDVLVEEWNELNSARSFREKQQAKTIEELKAKITNLESHIKVISATTHQILQFHQAQHSVENRFKNSSNLSRAK